MSFTKKIILNLLIFNFGYIFSHTSFIEENVTTLPTINKIPKIIHQIWVGGKKIPQKYKKLIKTVKDVHPDWEYKLWTNEMWIVFPGLIKQPF